MSNAKQVPLFRPAAILLAMLSLSIGWGIRDNLGHETGVMLPGALTGMAVCLLSGREDWLRGVLYFGFFGALGYGFGASMSYMQVLSYAQSGHAASQLYGYYGLFVIGFLTAAVGGACIAYPAVENRERLTVFVSACLALVVVGGLAYTGIARYVYHETAMGGNSPMNNMRF